MLKFDGKITLEVVSALEVQALASFPCFVGDTRKTVMDHAVSKLVDVSTSTVRYWREQAKKGTPAFAKSSVPKISKALEMSIGKPAPAKWPAPTGNFPTIDLSKLEKKVCEVLGKSSVTAHDIANAVGIHCQTVSDWYLPHRRRKNIVSVWGANRKKVEAFLSKPSAPAPKESKPSCVPSDKSVLVHGFGEVTEMIPVSALLNPEFWAGKTNEFVKNVAEAMDKGQRIATVKAEIAEREKQMAVLNAEIAKLKNSIN